jgi:hypothetical protein
MGPHDRRTIGRLDRTRPGVRAVAAMAACALAVAVLAGCSGSDGDATPAEALEGLATTPGGYPDLVGTWVGDYVYPWNEDDGTPEVIPATERLIIEHQEDGLLWGVDEYVDDGATVRIPVRGVIYPDGALTLAEEGGGFRGQLQPDGSLVVHFSRSDAEYTAFAAHLVRD